LLPTPLVSMVPWPSPNLIFFNVIQAKEFSWFVFLESQALVRLLGGIFSFRHNGP
jgi:hypothetical protein